MLKKESTGVTRSKRRKKQKKSKKDEIDEDEEKSDDEDLTPSLEQCPKWQALKEVLAEIAEEEDTCCETDASEGENSNSRAGILICAEDDRTCNQLREYLSRGGEKLLNRLFKKYLAIKGGPKPGQSNADAKGKLKGGDAKGAGKMTKSDAVTLTLTQMMKASRGEESDGDEQSPVQNPTEIVSSSKDAYGMAHSPSTIIHPLHGCTDPHGLARVLEELQPKYVVLYDPDMSLVRQLEVFKATRPGKPLRVYFMMYKGSVEEQRYLTTLRKEKEAFEYLIREKATMVITEEQDGRGEDDPNLARSSGPNSARSSRQGGIDSVQQPKVIVDMREFRSELPSLIHRRGIEIEPVTIEVGDYILTPDICVERKSVSDLIGSLNSGRLYQQALSMCRFYKKPMLLIEFDANKPFALQIKTALSGDVSAQDITSKLAMLTMHFPKLRLLWCPSPYSTAELFAELKAGRPQPSAELAMTVTAATSELPDWTDKYNHGPQDFVLRMPGINSKNYGYIMKKFTNLYEVSQASLDDLTQVLGSSSHAQQLYDFFHKEQKVDEQQPQTKALADKKAKWKGKGFVGKGRGVKRKK